MTQREGEPLFNPEEIKQEDSPKIEDVQEIKEPSEQVTPENLRNKVDALFKLVCNNFDVEGKEKLLESMENNPDAQYIIASSHTSNLDAGGAIKALGDKFNIQVTAESVLFGLTPQEAMFRLGGKENFSPLEYRKVPKKDKKDTGKQGIFNPEDFSALSEKMEEGKTPWFTIHPFTLKEKMQDARIGPVYLAHKTGSKIIPTALEIQGKGGALLGAADLGKRLLGKITGEANAIYHIGEVVNLPHLDVSIIEKVLEKRKMGEKITKEERQSFSEIHEKLKQEADEIALHIAEMLPEESRGDYIQK